MPDSGCDAPIRVRYAETDKMGVVYHANYLMWFEVGRVELLRKMGFVYRDLERDHDCHLPVVDVRVRYKSPAFYDDELIIRTNLKNVRSSFLKFSYEVLRRSDNGLLAEGETTHIVVNSKMEKTPLPEKYSDAFSAATVKSNHP
jgi:acyl-CoA thioester hydrolase